jgi:uncharacterized phage protein (TIGR02218 family)
MKSASSTLQAYITDSRVAVDVAFATADCFIITLSTGVTLNWTNCDYQITYNGSTFSCSGPLISGLKYKAAVGLEVDKQQITLAARTTDMISGAMALQAIREGEFDGAIIERHRLFLNAAGGSVIDGVMLFHGRVSTVDSVGRTRAQITVASDLIILDYDMPRNLYQATCNHVHYDSGCGVVAGTYSASGTAGAGSTPGSINWAGAVASYSQGAIVFSSGANANLTATVKSVVTGISLTLMYPLPETPAIGDTFTVAYGCDHTPNTCQSRFSNLANFRGFPYVPPPQIAY